MTIRRKYSLPNCILTLEGLSSEPANTMSNRPLLSIVVNAECRFTHYNYPLSGGKEFVESLTKAVSAYAQEFLSGVRHPQNLEDKQQIVSLTKVEDKNLHRLTCQGGGEVNGYEVSSKALQVDLTTVQLFDLVEAVDQFLADKLTLPELSLKLHPVSKRHRQAERSLGERTAPLALGTATLAIAAAGLFFVPIPEVREPEPQEEVENQEGEEEATSAATPAEEEEASQELDEEELEDLLTTASQIEDPTEIAFLQRQIRRDIDAAWENREEITEDLEYRVSATRDGAIVAFEPVEGTTEEATEKTPLPDLVYTSTGDKIGNQEEIAEFRVVFTDREILQISPWEGLTGEPGFGPEIEDKGQLRELNQELRSQIIDALPEDPSFSEDLEYRIGVTEEGVIADYEAENQPASDFVEQTPLPELVEPEAAGIGEEEGESLVPKEPLGQFRVVFRSNGVVEVSPLRGY